MSCSGIIGLHVYQRVGHTFTACRLTTGDDNPYCVHENVVEPEVVRLGPAIRKALVVVVKHARREVQHIAVDLSKGDEGLEWVSHRVVDGDHVRDEVGEGAPADLEAQPTSVPTSHWAVWIMWAAYCGGGLHAQHKWVRSQVS